MVKREYMVRIVRDDDYRYLEPYPYTIGIGQPIEVLLSYVKDESYGPIEVELVSVTDLPPEPKHPECPDCNCNLRDEAREAVQRMFKDWGVCERCGEDHNLKLYPNERGLCPKDLPDL